VGNGRVITPTASDRPGGCRFLKVAGEHAYAMSPPAQPLAGFFAWRALKCHRAIEGTRTF